jgi:hypothetical protein
MAQLFSPTTNTLARASLGAAILLSIGLIAASSAITRSPYNTKVNVPLDQPVPFSHEHHINELGIDCRYCHTSVEKSSFAGIPPTHTCMSCHSQIWTNSPLLEPIRESYRTNTPIKASDGTVGWTRVNKVPEFVYFNHSIHIARGINCNQCHGPVQKMQLTYKGNTFFMSWCLKCHRDPERYVYQSEEAKKQGIEPRQQVFNLYWKAQNGEEKLTARERSLINGEGLDSYKPSADELREGKELVKTLGVKKDQLADCWVCHR